MTERNEKIYLTLLAAAITGSSAFAAGAGLKTALWLALAGWCLAVGSHAFNHFYPVNENTVEPSYNGSTATQAVTFLAILSFGFAAFIFLTVVSLVVTLLAAPRLALVPLTLIVVFGFIQPSVSGAVMRPFLVALMHVLYMLMGFAAGAPHPILALPAAMIFFAAFAARAVIDIRDFPKELMTFKQTLPKYFKRAGMTKTVVLSIICLALAYVTGIVFYFVAKPAFLYLIPMGILILTGTTSAVLFVKKAGPPMARKLTPVFTIITVLLICLSLILGKV